MKIREGYKQTEVGIIPEDWKVKQLKDLSSMKSGNSITAKNINEIDRYPCFGGNGLRGYTASYTHNGEFALIGRQGALCGNIQYVTGAFFASEHAVVVTPNAETDIKWLSYMLIDMRLNRYSESSAQPGLSVAKILDIQVAAPTEKTEQQAIATALSDIDGLINSLQRLIDKKKNIKQGAMQELLAGKRRLEGFNGEWVEVQLGDIAEVTMGQSPDSRFYNTNNAGIPLVQGNADIDNRKTIIRNYTMQITKQAKKGDIIMTVRAPVGYIGKASYDCCIGRGVCAISCKNDYLYHYLVFIENTWSTLSKGSTFDSVNSKEVNELVIMVPPTGEEQTAIASILSDMDSEIEALERKLNKYKDIKQGMMQELLTGRVRLVEEVVQ